MSLVIKLMRLVFSSTEEKESRPSLVMSSRSLAMAAGWRVSGETSARKSVGSPSLKYWRASATVPRTEEVAFSLKLVRRSKKFWISSTPVEVTTAAMVN